MGEEGISIARRSLPTRVRCLSRKKPRQERERETQKVKETDRRLIREFLALFYQLYSNDGWDETHWTRNA